MKSHQRFIVTIVLCISLILGFDLNLTAQVSPDKLVQQAQRQYQLGKSAPAIQLLEEARKIYQSQSKPLSQAQAIALTALVQQQTGDWELARQNIDASLTLIDAVPSSTSKTQVLAQIWNIKGHYLFATGKHNQALANWQQAEQLYRQINDRLGISGTILDQAEALVKMGFYRRSCDRVLAAFEQLDYSCNDLTNEQITSIIEQTEDKAEPWQVNGLNSLGNSLLLMGKFSTAQRFIEASQILDANLFSSSSTNQAKILLSLGNINQALALQSKQQDNMAHFISHSQQAIKYYQQLDRQASNPVINSYKLLAQLNQLSLLIANQQWSQAKTLANKIQLPQDYQSNLYATVKFANSLNRLKQRNIKLRYSWLDIADMYRNTIQQAQLAEDHRIESYAWGYLGKLSQDQNLQLDYTPQQQLEQALILAQGEHAPEMTYRWQWHLGRIYGEQGQRTKAIASYQAALANLNDLRSDLVILEREVQFDFKEQIEPVYRELADLLLTGSPSDDELEMARNVIEALQVAELDNYFQDACITFEPRSIEQIDQQAAVIYTIVLPGRLEVILATSDNQPNPRQIFAHHTQTITQAELEATVQHLREYITEPDRLLEVQQLATQIYGWLIEPLKDQLSIKKPKTLVFVLDGMLQTIPMSALYDGKQYLIENYAIAMTPGLRLVNPQKNSRPRSFLAGGISKFLRVDNQEFSALTNVPDELENVTKLDKLNSQVLLDEQFTPENLLNQLNLTSATIVHLATHSQFRPNPQKTFLLMWQKLLTIKEFGILLQSRTKALANPINLFILSACETATGDRRAALGLAGIAVRNGSLSTLATLWQVNDDSTTELMKLFYQYLDGNHKAEALRQAQLELWSTAGKDWQVPAFWSPYVMIGNWQ